MPYRDARPTTSSVAEKSVGTPPALTNWSFLSAGTSRQRLYGCAPDQLNSTRTLLTPLWTISRNCAVGSILLAGSNSGPPALTPTNPDGTGVPAAWRPLCECANAGAAQG